MIDAPANPQSRIKKISNTLAPFILLVQLASLGFFAWKCAGLGYNNRIERFAVAHQDAEKRFQLFSEHFIYREHFLATLCFKGNDLDVMMAEGERIFDLMADLDGVSARHSFRTLPPGLDEQTQPFPFVNSEKGFYTGIFQLEPDWADLMETLPKLLEELKNNPFLLEIKLAGEPMVNDQLNRSSLEVRNLFFPILIACSLILLGLLFRSIKVVMAAGLAVGSGLATTMGIFAMAGQSMDLVTTLIPALIFVLAMAMQMHVLISIGMCGDVWQGLKKKLGPNFLVSLTTSIGFGSLAASNVAPIAVMGQFMAVGIWVIFFWTHVTHLGLSLLVKLQIQPPALAPLQRMVNAAWYWRWIRRPSFAICAVIPILAGSLLLVFNPMESNGLNYFHPQHPIREQTAFLQENITGASHLELLLERRDEKDSGVFWLPDGKKLQDLEESLVKIPDIRHIMSLGQIIKVGRTSLGTAGANVPDFFILNGLQSSRPELLEPFQSADYYRIQILVNSLDREAYHGLKEQIQASMEKAGFGNQYQLTGALDRLVEIQEYLLVSLSRSLSITIVAIMILMMVLLGRRGRILIILIPNLFPLGMMALAMGLFQIKTTISTVMVFSIAFGIAVDDTIHLLHTYYHTRNDRRFRDRWSFALGQDARAIMLTSLVLTVGFSVLIASSFKPTAQFGILMAVGMIFAFLGDTLFLPILLRIAALKDCRLRGGGRYKAKS